MARSAKLELRATHITSMTGGGPVWQWWVTIDRRRPYSDKLTYASEEDARVGAQTWLAANFPQYEITEE